MEHTDLYKLNLKSLKDGEHRFVYELDDAYFASLDTDAVSGGELDAEVVCLKRGDLHQLTISLDGYVVVQCDRCLGDLELDVVSHRDLIVKFGTEYREESDEIIIVPEREGVLDLHWLLWEDIALSLPLQRLHEEGECDGDMLALYQNLSTKRVAEDDGAVRDDEEIDVRWEALKKLRKN